VSQLTALETLQFAHVPLVGAIVVSNIIFSFRTIPGIVPQLFTFVALHLADISPTSVVDVAILAIIATIILTITSPRVVVLIIMYVYSMLVVFRIAIPIMVCTDPLIR
jgi:hypothetical protein